MTLPFADQLEHLPESPAWLTELRQKAASTYRETGLPTPRNESWKYTNLAPVLIPLLSRDSIDGSGPATIPDPLVPGSARAVFIDGVYSLEHSDLAPVISSDVGIWDMAGDSQAGVNKNWVGNFGLEEQSIGALNTALFVDGLRIISPFDKTVETPIEICFVSSGKADWHAKLDVSINPNTTMCLIERHVGTGSFVGTIASEIKISDGATLNHYRLQQVGPEAIVLATSAVQVEHKSLYDTFSLTTGGRLSRHQVRVDMPCPDSEVRLNGAHVLSGNSHADTTTEIRHMYPNCRSRETYRHVMDGTSRSVFQGKIFVAQDAQKTDGFQLNQSLMLSSTAEVNAKPELEIYADDVKCSHGATSGRLDEDALFYLRSRGIPHDEARQMLIGAFIGSSIDLVENETVRDAFRAHAASVLGVKGEG